MTEEVASGSSEREIKSSDFLLERYKYILNQKKDLNERSFKVASVYQATILAIAAAQYRVITDVQDGKVFILSGSVLSWSLFGLMCLASAFFIVLLIGGIASWLKYRKDEGEIEIKMFGLARPIPKTIDYLRWYETYLVAAGIVVPLVYFVLLYEVIDVAFRS